MIGGRDSENNILNDIVQYSSDSQLWTTKSALTIHRRAHACALLGSLVIIAGGYDNNHTVSSSVETYDLAKGITTVVTDMIKPRSAFEMTAG